MNRQKKQAAAEYVAGTISGNETRSTKCAKRNEPIHAANTGAIVTARAPPLIIEGTGMFTIQRPGEIID